MDFQKLCITVLSALSFNSAPKCRLYVSTHFMDQQPIMIRNGDLLKPSGPGLVEMNQGDIITLSCGDYSLQHPNLVNSTAAGDLRCIERDIFEAPFLNNPSSFAYFRCSHWPSYEAVATDRTCYDYNNVIEVGYRVRDVFYPLYESCFDPNRARVLYSKYEQKAYNSIFQTRGQRPYFIAENYFPGVPVEGLYMSNALKNAVTRLVGYDHYVNRGNQLSRGHLAAKTDFVFNFQQRATFHYVNCAPQWYGFNGGNWNTLEVDLRQRVGRAGYNSIIYTGTFGVAALYDGRGLETELYLYKDKNNNNKVPVPLYYYKVVYEPRLRLGIAFVGINNPHIGEMEARRYFFCEDQCRGDSRFNWLSWRPDSAYDGYSFCCHVDEFRMTVPHLPAFEVNGLLS